MCLEKSWVIRSRWNIGFYNAITLIWYTILCWKFDDLNSFIHDFSRVRCILPSKLSRFHSIKVSTLKVFWVCNLFKMCGRCFFVVVGLIICFFYFCFWKSCRVHRYCHTTHWYHTWHCEQRTLEYTVFFSPFSYIFVCVYRPIYLGKSYNGADNVNSTCILRFAHKSHSA